MADLDTLVRQTYKLIMKSADAGGWLGETIKGMRTDNSQSNIIAIVDKAIGSASHNLGMTVSDEERKEVEARVMDEINKNTMPSKESYRQIFARDLNLTDMATCAECGWSGGESELVDINPANSTPSMSSIWACPRCGSEEWSYMSPQENVVALPVPESIEDMPKAAMTQEETEIPVYAYNYVVEHLVPADSEAFMDGHITPHMEDMILDGLEKGCENYGEDLYKMENPKADLKIGLVVDKLMGKPFPWEEIGWQSPLPGLEVNSKYANGVFTKKAWFIRRKKLSPMEHYRRTNELRRKELDQKTNFTQDEALRKYKSMTKPKLKAQPLFGGYEVIEQDPIAYESAPEEFRNKLSIEEGGFAPVFNGKIRKNINKRLRGLGTYFQELPIGDVWKIIEEEGGNPYGLDGIYTGDAATIQVPVAKNSSLFFQWYTQETRDGGSRYEVTMYVG